MGLFRDDVAMRPHVPARPSHYGEDQNERRIEPSEDYPTEVVEYVDYGFTPAPIPTPVYQVEPPPSDRTLRQWAPGSMTADGTPQQIAGRDRRRTRMVVTNNDTDATVYLSREVTDTLINGYPLAPGRDVELTHNDSVWVRASGGDASAPIGWFVEYELDES